MVTLLGKDHTFPLPERETFLRLVNETRTSPSVLVATCNRVELYAGDGGTRREVARHLFGVTAGLESRMLGERHVQGQVKRAYAEAVAFGSVSSGLHRLFQTALRVGKRVRSETAICAGAASHSQAVISLVRSQVGCIADTSVLLVGVHRTQQRIAQILRRWGCETMRITNRSWEKAVLFAAETGSTAVPFEDLRSAIARADVVITATSSAEPIITPEHVVPGQPLLFVDLAVPRDVDSAVAGVAGVKIFNIEAIESAIDQNLGARSAEIAAAWSIVEQEARSFALREFRRELVC